jgi:hypothetical protein
LRSSSFILEQLHLLLHLLQQVGIDCRPLHASGECKGAKVTLVNLRM